jgi:hypothetical protein
VSRKLLAAVVAVLVAGAVFGAGYWVRGNEGMHPPILTADRCDMAWDGSGTCMAGGTSYGLPSSVMWLDKNGIGHELSSPDCLPKLSSVAGVRIAAGVLWFGDNGVALVLHVDCRAH